jgi:hypothetical protein
MEQTNFMVTSNNNERDPLLEILDQTFVREKLQDSQLYVLYDEILKKLIILSKKKN